MSKVFMLLGALAVLVVLIIIGVIIYSMSSFSSSTQKFKSGFQDLNTLEPIVRFHIENRKVKEMYLTQLNVDIAEVVRVYKRFIDRPQGDTPRHIYNSAVEIYEFLHAGGNFRNRSDDTNKLASYLINMDKTLTDYLNSKYFTADRLDGKYTKDSKILDEFTSGQIDDAYAEYLENASGGASDMQDIREDMSTYLNAADFPISRYVESLEMDPGVVDAGAQSVQAAYDSRGLRNRIANRPYPGSTNPRVISEDDPLPRNQYDTHKDYNVPSPGVLSGKVRDIDSYAPYWNGRRAGQVYNGM
jgi:hypothetical protein